MRYLASNYFTGHEAFHPPDHREIDRVSSSTFLHTFILAGLLLLIWAAMAPDAGAQVRFTEAEAGLTGVDYGSTSIADVNGDGNKDLLITGLDSKDSPTATLYLGDGQGGFTKAGAGLTGVGSGSTSIADVNGDGNPDFLITGRDANDNPTAKLYLGDGSGGFSEAGAGLTGVVFSSSSIAEVDGDGNKDLLITGRDANFDPTATLYLGDGQGGFSEAGANLTGVLRSSSSIAEVDGDGNKDLLITGEDAGQLPTATLYLGDGQGGFTEAGAGLTGAFEGSSSIADVNGDGNKDLLITGSASGGDPPTTLYLGDGQGDFTKAGAGLTGVGSGSTSIADVNGDGNPDLLITGLNIITDVYPNITGENPKFDPMATLYLEDGQGSFTEAGANLTGVLRSSSSIADVNGDGNKDLLITGQDTNGNPTATLYMNRSGTPPGTSVLYVDEDQTENEQTGRSWENAFTCLQDALDVASGGDGDGSEVQQIWVAEGTYKPVRRNCTVQQPEHRDGGISSSFNLEGELSIYGGFSGGEEDRSERSPDDQLTILSGAVEGGGVSNDVEHVVEAIGVGEKAVLDGFTVKNGRAGSQGPSEKGAGIFVASGDPILRNLRVHSNFARRGGGILIRNGSSPVLKSINVYGNEARRGAGIYVRESDPTIRNSTVGRTQGREQYAEKAGGGIFVHGGHVKLLSSTVEGNRNELKEVLDSGPLSASCANKRGGGGVFVEGRGHLEVANTTFHSNEASNGIGSAIALCGSRLTVQSSDFLENKGASIWMVDSGATVLGTEFRGNSALNIEAVSEGIGGKNVLGGAIRNAGSDLFVGNSIFAGNLASRGGALLLLGGKTMVLNSVFRGNLAQEAGIPTGSARDPIRTLIASASFNNFGGAISAVEDAEADIVNTTVSGNRARNGGRDGGGGGIYVRSGDLDVVNSILWSNYVCGRHGPACGRPASRPKQQISVADDVADVAIRSSSIHHIGSEWPNGIGSDRGDNAEWEPAFRTPVETSVFQSLDFEDKSVYVSEPSETGDLRLTEDSEVIDRGNARALQGVYDTYFDQVSLTKPDLDGDGKPDETVTVDADGDRRAREEVDLGAYEYSRDEKDPLLSRPDNFAAAAGDGEVRVCWDPPSGAEGSVGGYVLHHSSSSQIPLPLSNSDVRSLSEDRRMAQISELPNGEERRFHLATRRAGRSKNGDVASAAATPQQLEVDQKRVITKHAGRVTDVDVGPIDGDDYADIVVSTLGGDVKWSSMENGEMQGLRPLSTSYSYPAAVAIEKTSSDEDADVITGFREDQIIQFWENGGVEDIPARGFTNGSDERRSWNKNTLLQNSVVPRPAQYRDIHAARLDGSEKRDILSTSINDLQSFTDQVFNEPVPIVLKNRGEGSRSPTKVAELRQPTSVQTVDVNSDGRLDIVAATSITSRIVQIEQLSDGTFGEPTEIAEVEAPSEVDASDIDGDGDRDLIVGASGEDEVLLLQNEKTGFAAPRTIIEVKSPQSVDTGDIDGDGDLDIVVTSKFDHSIYWYEVNSGSYGKCPPPASR